MDSTKCRRLKEELASQPEPQVVAIERFFEGNDDTGSIGCNLPEHPGMDVFREALAGLTGRPDVEAVYAQIAELDPGEESWPFTDTILVAGSISPEELRSVLAPLQPDDVGPARSFGAPKAVMERHGGRVIAVWWD